LTWAGRLYGAGYVDSWPWSPRRIYHGTWGTALFQSVYRSSPTLWRSLPIMPEWLMLTLVLVAVAFSGLVYRPLILAAPFAAAAGFTTLVAVSIAAWRASIESCAHTFTQRARCRATLALLHLLQPLARLFGRTSLGLTPLRSRGVRGFALPLTKHATGWSEQWQSCEDRLAKIENELRRNGAVVRRGGEFDRWDLELCAGMFGGARLHLTVEEHGSGCQLVRVRTWPTCKMPTALLLGLTLFLASVAASQGVAVALASAVTIGVGLLAAHMRQCGAALATMRRALSTPGVPRAS